MAGNASRTMTIRFAGDSKGMTRSVKDVVAGLDETESAGKRVGQALGILADEAETGMKKASAASERLASALGDEVVASMTAAGRSVDGWVNDLRRMGLTFEEIEAEADALAAGIRRAEDVAQTSFRNMGDAAQTADDGIVRVRDSADQSRSVLANMVGNSVQDLGALGGVAGSAGVMIGQLGEYAADGNIKLSSLAKLAGPMVGLGLATAGVTAYMNAQRREAEELARITQFLGDLQEQIANNDFEGAAAAVAGEYEDTIQVLERYGYSVDDLLLALDGERMLVRQLNGDIRDLNDTKQQMLDNPNAYSLDDVAAVDAEIAALNDLIDTIEEDAAANKVAAEQRERNARVAAEAVSWFDRMAGAVENGSRAMDQSRTSADRMEGQIGSLQARLDEYVEALDGIPDEATTEVQAAIDAGDLNRAGQLLDQLTRPRVTPLYIVPKLLKIGDPAPALGRGPTAGAGLGKGPTFNYNPAAVLSGILSQSASGGGGGGGGGGASAAEDEPTPEEQAREFENAVANLFDTGQFSLAAYRDFLSSRLGLYETYSEDYKRIWSGLRELDRIEQDEKNKAAEAEKKRADEAKKAAEEAARAREAQLDALRQLLELLTGFMSVQYGNLEGSGGNVVGAGAAGLMTSSQLGGVIAGLLGAYQDGVT